jgi:hypothetical protein
MKIFIYTLLISYILFSCSSKITERSGPKAIDTVAVRDTFYVEPEEDPAIKGAAYDRMSTDSISIGKVSFQTHINKFIKEMGEPNSIVDPQYEAGWFAEARIPVKLYYYKGSSFHVFRDTAQMQKINFKVNPKLEWRSNNLTLNSKTSIDEVKNYFPLSYKTSITEMGNEDGHKIRLLFYHGQLLLSFTNGKLESLEYWEPL